MNEQMLKDLRACIELGEKATVSRDFGITDDGGCWCVYRKDTRPDERGCGFLVEDEAFNETQASWIASCLNLIRQHGPALEALLREREWRPIESAPKDGTLMDMWRNDGVRVPDVYWLHEFGSWSCVRAGTHYTHWMPLPAGPKP